MASIPTYILRQIPTPYFVILVTAVSASSALAVMASAPSFIATGDASGYAVLGREIIDNGYMIPSTNTLHYPGSQWIYPPVVPYMIAFLLTFTGYGSSAFVSIMILGAILVSLSCVPMYLVSRNLFGEVKGRIISLIFSCYPPSLYTLTWGGYPQLLAFVLMVWILYFALRFQDFKFQVLRSGLIEGLLVGALVLTHDVSGIATVLVFAAVTVYFLTRRMLMGSNAETSRNAAFFAISFSMGMVAAIYWYLPRLQWVLYSIFPTSSPVYNGLVRSTVSGSFYSSLTEDLLALTQVANGLLALWPIMIIGVGLFLAVLYHLLKHGFGSVKFLVLAFFVIVPLLLMVIEIGNPTLFARLSYIVILFSFPVVAYVVLEGISALQRRYDVSRGVKKHRGSTAVLLSAAVLVISNGAVAIDFNAVSHAYYSVGSANTPGVNGVADYFLNNVSNRDSIVCAPGYLGYYISEHSGNPVFSFYNYSDLTQPAEWTESHVAYVLIFESYNESSLANSYVTQYIVSYVVIPHYVNKINSEYKLVYQNEFYGIYLA